MLDQSGETAICLESGQLDTQACFDSPCDLGSRSYAAGTSLDCDEYNGVLFPNVLISKPGSVTCLGTGQWDDEDCDFECSLDQATEAVVTFMRVSGDCAELGTQRIVFGGALGCTYPVSRSSEGGCRFEETAVCFGGTSTTSLVLNQTGSNTAEGSLIGGVDGVCSATYSATATF